MKNVRLFIFIFLLTGMYFSGFGQKLNGNYFSYPNGISDWSTPVDKNLQSVKMDKKGIAPVPLVFRVKFQKRVTMGKWYYVEITNKSNQYIVEFALQASGVNQDKYNIKLKPGETKVFEKFNWHLDSFKDKLKPDDQSEDWGFVFEDISVK